MSPWGDTDAQVNGENDRGESVAFSANGVRATGEPQAEKKKRKDP